MLSKKWALRMSIAHHIRNIYEVYQEKWNIDDNTHEFDLKQKIIHMSTTILVGKKSLCL